MINIHGKNPIVVIALITAVCLVGDSMLYVVLPTHWQEAGLSSLWQVGILLAVNRIVRLPLNPVVGWLYHKISPRRGILFAVVLAFFTTLAYGFAKDFITWLILRGIWGLAWTFLRLGAYFTIIEVSDDSNRGLYMGRYNGLYRLGSLFGMLFGGFAADCLGIKLTAVLFGLITAAAIPLAFLGMPPKSYKAGQPKETSGDSGWKDRSVLWILSSGMFIAMIYQGIFTATLSHLIEVHNGMTIDFAELAVGAATLAGILQALRWSWEPWLAPWIGQKSDGVAGRTPALIASLLVAGGFFLLIPLEMPLLVWLLILLGEQIAATFLTTLADALASDAAASSSSKVTIMTLYSLLVDLGAAIGPLLAYLLNEYAGIYAVYWSAGVILLGIAAKDLLLKGKHKILPH